MKRLVLLLMVFNVIATKSYADNITINVGNSEAIWVLSGTDYNGFNFQGTWYSNKPSVADVKSVGPGSTNQVTGYSEGVATITCRYVYTNKNNQADSGIKTWTVTVRSVSPSSISLNYTSVTLEPGGTKQLSASVSPSGASQSVIWSVVSGSSVASVSSSGLVTAKSAGTATIRATSSVKNSVYKDCTVTVEEAISPTSISLNSTSVSLQVGGTKQLTATVSPSGASQSVTWSVYSGSSYVSVSSSGLVTAKSAGTATVRATSTVDNSVYKNCTVTVTEPTSSIVAGTWSGNTLTIDANATLSDYTVPYSNYYQYSTTQMLYTPTEIGKSGSINSIAFKVANASSFSTSEVKVYLGHKSGTFSGSSNYVTSSNLTLVYSGSPTLGQTTGWETLTFNKGTFNYNGTDNLVVVVTRKSDNFTSNLKYYYYNTGSGYALYRQNDGDTSYGDVTNTSNGYSTSTNRPAIRMVFTTTPTSISLNTTSFSLEVGGTKQLTATVLPSNASQSISWSVPSGSSYVSVSTSGLVTAKAPGTAVVRATSTANPSVYKNCTVTVTEKEHNYYYVGQQNGWDISNKDYPFTKLSDGITWELTMTAADTDNFVIGIDDVAEWWPNDNIFRVSSSSGENSLSGMMTNADTNNYNFWPNVKGMISYTIRIIPSTMHFEIEVNVPTGKGTLDDPYTVQDMINIVSALDADIELNKDCYVKGVVTEIPVTGISTQYNNVTFYISDDVNASNQFYVYRAKGLNGGDVTEDMIKIGDEVIIFGNTWVNYNGNFPESKQGKAYIVSINSEEDAPLSDGDYFTAKTVEGVDMTFQVLSVEYKLCSVYREYSYPTIPVISSTTSGTVTIPSEVNGFTVMSIGSQAFYNCTNLTTVNIPNSVIEISSSAFSGCTSITSITIPNSVQSIGRYAFSGCTSLTTISLPNSLERIGDGAFNNTAWFNSLPDGMAYIGKVAYKYKGTMPDNTSIELIEGTTVIGDDAFVNNTGLFSITIPNSVKFIGVNAFWGCDNLTSVTLGMAIPPTIYSQTFPNRTNATLYVPYGRKAAYEAADVWKECREIIEVQSVELQEGNTFTATTVEGVEMTFKVISTADKTCRVNTNANNHASISESTSGTITIPETVDGFTVTAIGDAAFAECYDLTGIIIPGTVTSIAYAAFSSCEGLTSIVIPSSVTAIGSYAFADCTGLNSITSEIEEPFPVEQNVFTFYDNGIRKPLTATLYVPAGTSALYQATDGWNLLASIEELEPEGLQGGDIFTEADITYQVISASEKTAQLKRGADVSGAVNIPSEVNGYTVTAIGKAAFRELRNITAVTIPNSVVTMERSVFDDCSNLTSVSIPGSVTSIGERLFTGCQKLTSVTVANDNPVYDSRNNCNAIIETATNTLIVGSIASVIPESVVRIATRAFEDIRGMVSVVIPEGVTTIEEEAFIDCSDLQEVTLPSTLASIGMDAFCECPSITKVTSLITTPFAIDKWTFGIEDTNCEGYFNPVVYNTATLYVPYGCKAAYEAVDYWKKFKEIVEMESEEVMPTDISALTDAIYANAVTGLRGSTATLTINLKNAQTTNGYSFDLKLPEGVILAKDNNDDYVYTLSNRHNGHVATVNYKDAAGVYGFAVMSLSSKDVKESDGTIMTVALSIDDEMAEGDYAVKVQNARYSLSSGATSVVMEDVTSLLTIENCIKGDANGDGSVDIADAVCIVNHIVGKTTPAYIEAAADANGDGVVDIADAVRIVNLIVGKIDALARKMDMDYTLPEPE